MMPGSYPRAEYRQGMCLNARCGDSKAMNDLNADQIGRRQPWTDQVARRHAVTEHKLRDLLDRVECVMSTPNPAC